MDKDLDRVHVKINGRVQGVGFRYFTRNIANELGCVGWVRNRVNGSVESVAEGTRTQLEAFIKAVKKGPRSGYVDNLIEDWAEGTGEFKKFKVRMTC